MGQHRYREVHGPAWSYSSREKRVETTVKKLRVRKGQRVILGMTFYVVTRTYRRQFVTKFPDSCGGREIRTNYYGALLKRERDMTDAELVFQFARKECT